MGERMKSPTLYGQIQSFSCDSFHVADRMGLDGTMLQYLAVLKAVVSVHKPVHLKITLTYLVTWQTDPENGFQGAIKHLGFAQVFPAHIVRKNCQNRLLLKHSYMYCRLLCMGTLMIHLRSIKSSLPLHHSHDKLSQALSRFSVLQVTESWAGPGNEAATFVYMHDINSVL